MTEKTTTEFNDAAMEALTQACDVINTEHYWGNRFITADEIADVQGDKAFLIPLATIAAMLFATAMMSDQIDPESPTLDKEMKRHTVTVLDLIARAIATSHNMRVAGVKYEDTVQ